MSMSTQVALTPCGPSLKRVCQTSSLLNVVPNTQCPMALGDGQHKFVGQNGSTTERFVSWKTGCFNSHRF